MQRHKVLVERKQQNAVQPAGHVAIQCKLTALLWYRVRNSINKGIIGIGLIINKGIQPKDNTAKTMNFKENDRESEPIFQGGDVAAAVAAWE
jgi:hypothetical protein